MITKEETNELLKRLGSDFTIEETWGVDTATVVMELARAIADRIELQEKELRILQDAFFRQSLRAAQK